MNLRDYMIEVKPCSTVTGYGDPVYEINGKHICVIERGNTYRYERGVFQPGKGIEVYEVDNGVYVHPRVCGSFTVYKVRLPKHLHGKQYEHDGQRYSGHELDGSYVIWAEEKSSFWGAFRPSFRDIVPYDTLLLFLSEEYGTVFEEYVRVRPQPKPELERTQERYEPSAVYRHNVRSMWDDYPVRQPNETQMEFDRRKAKWNQEI